MTQVPVLIVVDLNLYTFRRYFDHAEVIGIINHFRSILISIGKMGVGAG